MSQTTYIPSFLAQPAVRDLRPFLVTELEAGCSGSIAPALKN
jgi:hypothetical protein